LKNLFLFSLLTYCALTQTISAQDQQANPSKYTAHNKGKMYIFWGGNRESYSKSDIHFRGENYNFTLHDITANDKPKGWHVDYFNPARMTIPQTNLRIGYFISDNYNISIGIDHMKYVMNQNQVATISGNINEGGQFDGTYNNDPIVLTEDFLTFEHTDGLNYINTEICRVDDISKIFKLNNTDIFQINLTEGIGAGFLYPKTNATVMGRQRYDEFHISGYGLSAKIGLNFTFFKHFFLQTEFKGGYIDMNDIRVTHNPIDRASQHFFFLQRIVTIGGIFKV
jgi:hypothetical protein